MALELTPSTNLTRTRGLGSDQFLIMIWRYLGTPASLPAEKPALQYTNFDCTPRPHSQPFIDGGARFAATNSDVSGLKEFGNVPVCSAVAALIESATGKAPFFIGKPNPLMMRMAFNYLGRIRRKQ